MLVPAMLFSFQSGDLQDTLGEHASPRPLKSRPFNKSAWKKIMCIFLGCFPGTSRILSVSAPVPGRRNHGPLLKVHGKKFSVYFFGVAFETSYFILIAVIAVAQRRHPPTTHTYSDFVDDPYIKQCFCFVEFASLCGRYR